MSFFHPRIVTFEETKTIGAVRVDMKLTLQGRWSVEETKECLRLAGISTNALLDRQTKEQDS